MLENGIAGAKDRNAALKLDTWACEHGAAAACVHAGLLLEEKPGADLALRKQALGLYEKACSLESAGDGCASFDEYKRNYGSFYDDNQLKRRSCDGGTQSELGCFNAAIAYANAPLEDDAKMNDRARRACKSGNSKKDLCKSFR